MVFDGTVPLELSCCLISIFYGVSFALCTEMVRVYCSFIACCGGSAKC